jgi:hypothetical protein
MKLNVNVMLPEQWWGDTDGGKIEEFAEKPVPLLLHPTHVPHGLP